MKNTNLVHFTTQNLREAEPVTTSRIIAEEFGKRHADVIRDIRKHIDDGVEFFNERKIALVKYKDDKGEMRPEYQLNFDQFIFTVMSYTGKKANKIKTAYIKAFNMMKHELTVRTSNRLDGIIDRYKITDAIKNHILDKEEVPEKKHAIYYSNYSKLAFRVVTGLQPSKYRELHKIPSHQHVRDYLSKEEIQKLQETEIKMCHYIELLAKQGNGKKAIYQELKEIFRTSGN